MAAILNGGELTLSGDVGESWFGDAFTYSEVVVALAQIEDDSELLVRLNSGGGDASEGAAIHALLSGRSGTTNVLVEGIAASAASLIAMAGENVTMAAGAVMMIHDPMNISVGNSDDHAKSIEYLEALATSYARVYASKSGKTADECRAIMKAERWLTADQAVEEGFADAPGETKAKAVAAFDYRAYAHAPKRLTALAAKKNWRLPDANDPAARSAAQPGQKEEKSMTDKERADQLAAELATVQAKATADAAELAALKAEKEDRERHDAILALPEAEGRDATAKALASAKGTSVAAAKAVLAATPKAEGNGQSDATAFERQRLNAEGLNGGSKTAPKAKTGDQATATANVIAKMKKLAGLKEGA